MSWRTYLNVLLLFLLTSVHDTIGPGIIVTGSVDTALKERKLDEAVPARSE
jgi:hypothetical protein